MWCAQCRLAPMCCHRPMSRTCTGPIATAVPAPARLRLRRRADDGGGGDPHCTDISFVTGGDGRRRRAGARARKLGCVRGEGGLLHELGRCVAPLPFPTVG